MKTKDSKQAYTGGPWFPVVYANFINLQTTPFYSRNNLLDLENYKEAEANATLAATAPELLEVLKQLVHLHMCEQEGIASGMPTANQWLKAVDEAAKAIAKAEGRSNG